MEYMMDRTWFLILTTEQRTKCVKELVKSDSVNSCDICNEDLFANTCQGCPFEDRPVREILIESYIPLARYIAGTFRGYKSDELLEVAFLAIVEAISRIPKLSTLDNVDAYIGKYLIGELKTHIKRLSLIHVPKWAWDQVKFNIVYLGNYQGVCHSEEELSDLQEFIRSIPTTPKQEIILRLTLEGYTDEEIRGQVDNISRVYVTQIKNKMLDKLRKELTNV